MVEAGVAAAFVALPVANSEAEGVVEVAFGLEQAGDTVAGNVLVVVVAVPGTVAVVAVVVEAAWVAKAVMAAEGAEVAEAAMAVEDA